MSFDINFLGSTPSASDGQLITALVSGGIATIAALSSAWLSSIATRNALRRQLKHDAQQKKIERRSILRREVYMQYTDCMVTAFGAIGSAAGVEFSQAAAEEKMLRFSVAHAKMCTVAREAAAEMAFELAAKLTELWVSVIAERVPLTNIFEEAKRLQNRLWKIETSVESLKEERNRIVVSPANVGVRDQFGSSILALMQQQVELSGKILELHEKAAPLAFALVKRIGAAIAELQPIQRQLLIQMRRDVGGKTSDAFVQRLNAMQSSIVETLNNTIETLERGIEQAREKSS